MAICRKKFDPAAAYSSHEGTILAADVAPEGVFAPFEHAYGYLMNSRSMAGHAHPTDEIYLVLAGSGYVILGGQNRAVSAGDTVAIPAGQWHTMLCTDRDQAPFLWAALWWLPEEGRPALPEGEIRVKRFDPAASSPAHGGTILADSVVPEGMPTPFGHAYGYLQAGQTMEAHSHPTSELYIVYSGTGDITVGNETEAVGPGDVVAIPPDATHSLTSHGGPLLWAALWWEN